jgi:hypothetical protein
LIEFSGAGRLGQVFGRGNCQSESIEVISPTEGAGPMAGGESDRLVEEEKRGPGAGPGEGMFPVFEVEPAGNPGGGLMMADDFPFLVDQTPAVTGKGAPGRDGVEITPGVDPVAKRHA